MGQKVELGILPFKIVTGSIGVRQRIAEDIQQTTRRVRKVTCHKKLFLEQFLKPQLSGFVRDIYSHAGTLLLGLPQIIFDFRNKLPGIDRFGDISVKTDV